MRSRYLYLFMVPLAVIVFTGTGCRSTDKTPEISIAIKAVLDAKAPPDVEQPVWADVQKLYQQREYRPAWTDHKHADTQSNDALQALRDAERHGFDPQDFGEADIVRLHTELAKSDKNAPDRVQRLANFEVRVSTALLAVGRDVGIGRTTPEAITGQWKNRRQAPDLVASFERAVSGNDTKGWLDVIAPPHPEYKALQEALASLRGQQEKGGWPAVPSVQLKPGQSHQAVIALRKRLIASGQLKNAGSPESNVFDAELEEALKSFQTHHGLPLTGTLDTATLAALNVPLDHRIAQVKLNLERWRWMPDDLGARHLLVNIPQYHVIARENGKPVLDIRVVVGKRGTETPIFSDEMTTVVFSPFWNIPDSIAQGETAPAAARNPGYLARNNIEVVRAGGGVVDPSTIDWSNPSAVQALSFRQRPGSSNALGHVKFLFPNPYNVYLHDTPADSLFARPSRAYSHGCIRVEEPETLAKYILRGYSEWNDTAILEAMHSGNERHVKLKEEIPVHVVYLTSWVDENGGIHFRNDVYGYDERQLSRSERPSRRSPVGG